MRRKNSEKNFQKNFFKVDSFMEKSFADLKKFRIFQNIFKKQKKNIEVVQSDDKIILKCISNFLSDESLQI